jgi:hypothetical protein
MIAGIVIASLACLFATIAVVLLCLARHKRRKQESVTIDTIPMSQLGESPSMSLPNSQIHGTAQRIPPPMVGQYSSRVSEITAPMIGAYVPVGTADSSGFYSSLDLGDQNQFSHVNGYINGNVGI